MPRDQLLDTRAGGGRGYRGARTDPVATHQVGERFHMPNAHVRHSRYITLAGCKGTLNTYPTVHSMPEHSWYMEDRFSASWQGGQL